MAIQGCCRNGRGRSFVKRNNEKVFPNAGYAFLAVWANIKSYKCIRV